MPEYQFAEKDGKIINVEYDGSTCLTVEQVKLSLEKAFSLFPYSVTVSQVENYEDVFKVTYSPESGKSEIYICAKGTTPGGRSGLKNEQRIQPKAKYLNFVNSMKESGKKAVFLGVYKRDEQEIFCTWKVNHSEAASEETPISKQIKITSIASAMKEGFVQQDKGRGVYACAFKPEFLYFYLNNSEWLHTGHVTEITEHDDNVCKVDDVDSEKSNLEDSRISVGANVLLYGVPGSGKSWTIEHEYCKKGTNVERLVFHPDYTYSDFIGQILPNVSDDGQVSYMFTPGPFTNILADAYCNPDKEYILIIEEINRGNAPAIFGEVFQLLDRKTEIREVDDDGYPIGTSEYGITNANIAKIVYGNEKHKIRIPSNLSIIGTMNTSDQNVFTLDTAFQRRWEMRLIENNFEYVDRRLAEAEILDTEISWEVFCTQINKIIVGNNARMTSAEDKRLGAYFVHLKDLVYDSKMGNLSSGEYDTLRKKEQDKSINDAEKRRLAEIRAAMKQNRKFPEKVIKYLWDDAFKFNREIVFETATYQSLEQVIRTFMYAEKLDRLAMFKDNVRNAFTNPEQ